ncbi:MAG: hypothetical protein ACRDPN_16070 [Aeromicrobium sp.]
MRLPAAGAAASVVSVLVIAVALGGGWWAAALKPDTRPALTSALDALPANTTVVGFTDWSRIRDHLGLGVVDTTDERNKLSAAAARRDLSTRSVIGGKVGETHDLLGWSPADVGWEVYGQDPDGTAAVVRLGRSISFDDVRSKLRAAGYRQDGPRWKASKPTGLPETFVNIALVPRQRLVVLSDRTSQVARVLDVVHGRARSLAGSPAAAETARALAGSDSVLMQGGTLACQTTAVSGADRERQARAAIDRAGDLQPYRFSGRAIVDRGGSGFSAQRLVFAMTFKSAVVASEQAQVRARLATGPFIGRNVPIDETLRLRSSVADESTVRMSFAHDPETYVFMTGTGPVLFATC